MRRRSFMGGLVASGALTLLCAGVLPVDLPRWKAEVREGPKTVWVYVDLRKSELLRPTDRDAMANLDAGFATRLVMLVEVYRGRERRPIEARKIEIQLHYDPWNRHYVVERRVDGRLVAQRKVATREAALREALVLRLPVARVENLQRGREQTYFVTISALRNPVGEAAPRVQGPSRRARGEWFDAWVGWFAREQVRAERSIQVRTTPAFYLPRRPATPAEDGEQ